MAENEECQMNRIDKDTQKFHVPVTVLLIEDDAVQRETFSRTIMDRPMLDNHIIVGVLKAGNLEEALSIAESQQPDLVILDDNIPRYPGSGSEYLAENSCKALRRIDKGIPIILLTGKYDGAPKGEANLVKLGLANHYKRKPVTDLGTFLNRIDYELGVRESSNFARLKFGPWVYCADRKPKEYNLLSRNGGQKDVLDPMKTRILHCLYRRRGLPVSTDDLMMEVWGDSNDDDSHKLNVHISEMRKKLRLAEEDYHEPVVKGLDGYRLNFRCGQRDMAS